MSASTPRQKAERCFALARSTTYDGEREAAISRGTAICEREGLDLDAFDIPGRERKARGNTLYEWVIEPDETEQPRARSAGFDFSESDYARGHEYGTKQTAWRPFYTSIDISDLMREMESTMLRQRAEAAEIGRRLQEELMARAAANGSGFAAGYEAGVIQRALNEAAKRAQQNDRWSSVKAAIDFLFSRGVPVYDLGDDDEFDDGRWYAPSHNSMPLHDRDLFDLADEIAGT